MHSIDWKRHATATYKEAAAAAYILMVRFALLAKESSGPCNVGDALYSYECALKKMTEVDHAEHDRIWGEVERAVTATNN